MFDQSPNTPLYMRVTFVLFLICTLFLVDCFFVCLFVHGGPTRVLAQPGYLRIEELQYMNVISKEGNLLT